MTRFTKEDREKGVTSADVVAGPDPEWANPAPVNEGENKELIKGTVGKELDGWGLDAWTGDTRSREGSNADAVPTSNQSGSTHPAPANEGEAERIARLEHAACEAEVTIAALRAALEDIVATTEAGMTMPAVNIINAVHEIARAALGKER